MKVAQISDEQIIKYLIKLIELNKLHKDTFGDGKSLVTPTLISECIVRKAFKLKQTDDKAYDAEDFNHNKYEIKASSSEKGTVTINSKSEPDYLIWIYFDYSSEQLILRKAKFNKKLIKKCASVSETEAEDMVIKSNETSQRQTIQLKNIDSGEWIETKKYSMVTLKEIPEQENE